MIGWYTWLAQASFAQQTTEPIPQDPIPKDAADPDVIEIEPVDELPSAIDTLGTSHEEVAIGPQLGDWTALPGPLIRGRPMLRPLLAVSAHSGSFALKGGLTLGHQWWTLTEEALQIGGETRFEMSAPIGAARGYRLELSTRAGPWLGPVGLRLGPLLRADREQWGDEILDTGLILGGSADLSLLLGPIVLLAGVEPGWAVIGERPAAVSGPLPALGTEQAWRAGIGTTGQPLQFSVELLDRQTAIGPIIETSLSLRIRVF